MVIILNAGWEIVIAGFAVIIAGLAITISCHEPNFTVGSDGMRWGSGEMGLGSDEMRWGSDEMGMDSSEMRMVADEMALDSGMTTVGMGMAAACSGVLPADSGILPAGAILVGVMGDGMGMWGGVGGNREGGDSANNCSGGVQLFVNKHIT